MEGDQSGTGQRRVTVAEAARILGLTVEAVRGRIKRGKLDSVKEEGTVYVLLREAEASDRPRPASDQARPVNDRLDDQAQLVEALREQVTYMREQLAEEREARRRADAILAQLSQANSEQARTIRAIEAPGNPASLGSEPRESPTGDAEEPEGAQEAAERRSWWRRWLGFE